MKKSRRIVKKMSKKSLINKKALRYIIANSNLCKHAIRELELAGYSKEEDGPNKWMREQVIEAVAYFVALVREPKGDHRGGGADGQGVWWQSLRVADG